MIREANPSEVETTESRRSAPVARVLATGQDWCVSEYKCNAGPADRPFEERHESFTIAAVVEGTFNYHADSGRGFLHPGAFLLGNLGTCFECGHDHSRGDRCIALHLAPEYFSEVAAVMAGTGRFTFPVPMLPAAPERLPLIATFEARAATGDLLEIEETVAGLVEAVVGAASTQCPSQAPVTARDERRISCALHFIEEHANETLSLDQLAAVAAMSKYHFLRTFHRSVGVTPYQFLLGVRMRRAAVCLTRSGEAVSSIALEAGFGDLSTFNRRFRDLFGVSPQRFRRRMGRA